MFWIWIQIQNRIQIRIRNRIQIQIQGVFWIRIQIWIHFGPEVTVAALERGFVDPDPNLASFFCVFL